MRKALTALALILFCAVCAYPQGSPLHNIGGNGGIYYSSAYNNWHATVVTAPTATGAGSITVTPGQVTLADGYSFLPFSTNSSITVGLGTANQEVVTPSAVSGCNSGGTNPATCTITATFANTHGPGDIVTSGSLGVQEAIQDVGTAGGGLVYFAVDCGPVTLSTSGATTTITGCQVPTSYIAMGGSAFVKTTITTSASYSLGTAAKTTAFINACTSLTAGTNCAAFAAAASPVNSTGTTNALTNLLITANATAGAGVVHVRAWGYVPVQSLN